MKTSSRKGAALVGAAAAVTAAAIWPAVAGADPTGHRSGRVVVGAFTTDRTEESFIDGDADPRPSLGDEIVYTNSSRGPLGAGTEYGRCLLHEVTLAAAAATATLSCTSVTETGRGSLTAQGSARVTLRAGEPPELLEPATSAITGGTGRFLRARGDIEITAFQGEGLDLRTSGRMRVVLAP